MRFKPHPDGEAAFAAMLPNRPGVRMLAAAAGDWNFVISYDLLHKHWSASYQVRRPVIGKRYTAQPVDPTKTHFATQAEAEKACERRYRDLRSNN